MPTASKVPDKPKPPKKPNGRVSTPKIAAKAKAKGVVKKDPSILEKAAQAVKRAVTPKKQTPPKRPRGRPTVITDVVIAKLSQAFGIGCSALEACSYADISKDAFYDFLKNEPEFSDRFRRLRDNPVLAARQTVFTAIKTDKALAYDFLKAKRPAEFQGASSQGPTVNLTFGLPPSQFVKAEGLPDAGKSTEKTDDLDASDVPEPSSLD